MKRRRWLLKLGLFMLAISGGAIVNVAVAWGCAVWSPRAWNGVDASPLERDFWMVQPETMRVVRLGHRNLDLQAICDRGIGVEQRRVQASCDTIAIGQRVELRAGWPMMCLSGRAEAIGDRWSAYGLLARSAMSRHPLQADRSWRALPLQCDFTAFAMNTAIYGLLLWLLLFALRQAAQSLRILDMPRSMLRRIPKRVGLYVTCAIVVVAGSLVWCVAADHRDRQNMSRATYADAKLHVLRRWHSTCVLRNLDWRGGPDPSWREMSQRVQRDFTESRCLERTEYGWPFRCVSYNVVLESGFGQWKWHWKPGVGLIPQPKASSGPEAYEIVKEVWYVPVPPQPQPKDSFFGPPPPGAGTLIWNTLSGPDRGWFVTADPRIMVSAGARGGLVSVGSASIEGGLIIAPQGGANSTPLIIPFAVLWPGLVGNILILAGALTLADQAARFSLRRMRLRRGVCPGCGYPIGASATCSECGEPVRPRSFEAVA